MTLLLLAGSGEARELAEALDQARLPTIASLAGITRSPKPLPVPTRSGGFGGEAGFRDYLIGKDIKAVLDATHPFAAQMSNRAAKVCAALGIPHCQYLRPAWHPDTRDTWLLAETAEAAAEMLPRNCRAFLALGKQAGAAFKQRRDCWLALRIAASEGMDLNLPWDGGAPGSLQVQLSPPFSKEVEVKLFEELQVDWLVCKNSGGEAGQSKLQAARHLGLKVLMIQRPEQPDCRQVSTVQAALDWALLQKLMP